jgi:hypothetical protein
MFFPFLPPIYNTKFIYSSPKPNRKTRPLSLVFRVIGRKAFPYRVKS